MWPFGRKLTIEVEHKIVGLADLTDAVRELAEARRYAAKMSAGRIQQKVKPQELDDPEWAKFLANNPNREVEELIHMEWAYRILTGKDRVDEETRSQAIRVYSAWRHAGIELPEIDGRMVHPAKENLR